MAATDQVYRNQYGLDIVFAVSSILMLASTVWMLVADYQREYKTEQRVFRDVEVAMAQREALLKMPTRDEVKSAKKEVEASKKVRNDNQDKIKELTESIYELQPVKEKADFKLANLNALLASKLSFFDIEADQTSAQAPEAIKYKSEVEELQKEIAEARNEAEKLAQKIKDLQRQKDKFEGPLTVATGKLKKLLDDFDRQLNTAVKKQWGIGDVIRSIPPIDGFASPTKIEQITLRDLTIDYSFMGVTRFDRCTTCHKAIARPTFTKENLEDLWYAESPKTKERLEDAKWILTERSEMLAGLPEGKNLPHADQLNLAFLSDKKLTQARVNEFSAHPRLDLYVGPNSKHPAEKFGCTPCHGGQPSGTSFTFAAHTPNDQKTLEQWKKEHDWESQHMWDYPMNPKRFLESSCLKCHHQVTDLNGDGNKSDAPKLLKGYNLIREFGCFGCHEINGFKGGRQIGPDLRLEPHPPLEKQSPADRAKLLADPDNPPGAFRKVGPSLARLSEKTYEDWAVKWITAPREFRPDTKMPHYYGLSNNDKEALAGTGQEKFPATEVHGIVHYLFAASRDYVASIANAHNPKGGGRVAELLAKSDKLTDDQKKELEELKALGEIPELVKELGDIKGDAKKGRDLFSKRGCLACHSHAVTNEPDDDWPALPSEAEFGPNLTQVKEKLVKAGDTKQARIWLTNWVKNPTVHNPRTRMPVTHLTDQEAADIASWLLAQNIPSDKNGKIADDLQGPGWSALDVPAPKGDDLEKLARVYLDRVLAASEVKDFFGKGLPEERVKILGADERDFADLLAKAAKATDEKTARRDALLHFVGKKAISRLGCYACHDIPGFESAKPIGTPLVDWGNKKSDRLAFEDIANYVNHHTPKYQVVDNLLDEDGYPRSVDKGPIYEKFYYDALMHQTREGFLNQKLLEPRSYDYSRIRAWDDRSRMPQFKFGRTKMKLKEEETDFNARKMWAEAMDRPLDSGAKPRPAESLASFLARKELLEAENREAVMTFVLGLVGETMPLQYVNQPGPDRLAEIKGRQVLDKFNCAGCHVVRPGVYEIKLNARSKPELESMYKKNVKDDIYRDDHFFQEHRAWQEPLQRGEVAVAHGVRPLLSSGAKKARVNFILTEALNLGIGKAANGKAASIEFRSKDLLSLAPGDLIWPPPDVFSSTEGFQAWEREHGTQGGAFATLLGSYLKDESYPDKKLYVEPGPAVPPSLIWEGERTQPDWLFQFLLDPQKVRELTVLRMPRFNMSPDEAKILVDYFSAIEKRFNPDTDLIRPYPKIPQKGDLDSEYWRAQTAKYIKNLEKDDKEYRKEVDALKQIWEQMRKDWEAEAKTAKERKQVADAVASKVAKEFADAKGDKEKELLKKKKEDADQTAIFWKTEMERLDDLVKTKTLQALEKDWKETEAYALAGYRLLVNQCNKCHAVGTLQAQQLDGRGPSLNLASMRLRSEWAKRWIANPQRFVSYISAMPAYFKKSEVAPLVPWLPGPHFEQIEGARDAILNLPRILDLPLTRQWMQSGGK